jgi:trans-aconitate methyltransferase
VERPVSTNELKTHWDAVYAEGDATKSWTQRRPHASLAAVHALVANRKHAAIIDIGGGSSSLAAELVEAGYTDVSVLDISDSAMMLARERMGARAEQVWWIATDLLDWRPGRQYALWHDRATLHFFTADADRNRYGEVARAAIAAGGYAVIATFAPDGPTECSGLPVRRHAAEEIAELLGARFTLLRSDRELHQTPGGSEQAFTWALLQSDGLRSGSRP